MEEIISLYELNDIKMHVWHVQPCSGRTAEGLLSGLQWLSEQMIFTKENRFPNNPYLAHNYNKVSVDELSNRTSNSKSSDVNKDQLDRKNTTDMYNTSKSFNDTIEIKTKTDDENKSKI